MTGWYVYNTINDTAGSGTAGNSYYCNSGDTVTYTGTSSGTTWETDTYLVYESPPETEEQKETRLAREAEHQKERERLKQERELAVKQAEDLLKEHIGSKAFGELYKVGYIEIDMPGK